MIGETQTEHRKAQRRPTLKGGRIVFNSDRSTFDCTVRNLSRQGAKLQVGSSIGIPDSFDLMLPNTERQACKVVWRKQREVGVEFININ
jgi:PilZ domain